jgi:hypothetical protein
MIIGDPKIFAIESAITRAYDRLSFRALGFFVIYIKGECYGVRDPQATMIACSLNEVENRLSNRGFHVAPFAEIAEESQLAIAFTRAIYAPEQENEYYFGLSHPEFCDLVNSRNLEWAPDGDEAFDDGSHVLHFDQGNLVRLVGFKREKTGYEYVANSLRSIWLESDEFYDVLRRWHDAFLSEWNIAHKE